MSDAAICDSVPARLLSQRDDAAVYACSFALTIPSNGYDEIRVFEDESHHDADPRERERRLDLLGRCDDLAHRQLL
jgi:hypothetical protein